MEIVKGVLITILLLALARVVGIDVTGWLDAAVNWTYNVITGAANAAA